MAKKILLTGCPDRRGSKACNDFAAPSPEKTIRPVAGAGRQPPAGGR